MKRPEVQVGQKWYICNVREEDVYIEILDMSVMVLVGKDPTLVLSYRRTDSCGNDEIRTGFMEICDDLLTKGWTLLKPAAEQSKSDPAASGG